MSKASSPAINIRPFEETDLRAVADLYERLYRSGTGKAPEGLVNACRQQFVETPARADDIPSLVAEHDAAVVGFQGMNTRSFEYAGATGRMACLSMLYVAPEYRGMVGFWLMRRALDGPQDFSMSDDSSYDVARLWERLGGVRSVAHSMEWTVPLKPLTWQRGKLAQRYRGDWRRFPVRLSTPLVAAGDRLIRRRWLKALGGPGPRAGETREMTAERWCALAEQFAGERSVCIRQSPAVAAWTLERLQAFPCRGPLVAREVIAGDRSLGWYIGLAGRDGVFLLLQLQGGRAHIPRLLATVIRDAADGGLSAVTGRVEADIAAALVPYRTVYTFGKQVLLASANTALLHTAMSLDTNLSRTDGEWLVDMVRQPY